MPPPNGAPLPTCWKCDGLFSDTYPGQVRYVQRNLSDDLIYNEGLKRHVPREHLANPTLCPEHGPSIVEGIGQCGMSDCATDERHCYVYECVHHDAPQLVRGVSTPRYVYHTQERRLPVNWQGHEHSGEKWVAFHDGCGPPSNPDEAWGTDGWQNEAALDPKVEV